MAKVIFILFSFILLVYMLIPGPSSIKDFPALPNSSKSTLEGDTIQVPNVSAYFSNNYRDFATNFYKEAYQNKMPLPVGLIKLNYPPEFAFTAIKDQTHSTYLEEYTYPLKESLFVNGLEPFDKEGNPRYKGAVQFKTDEGIYWTKVTLRYYPSPLIVRVLVLVGICAAVYLLWKEGKGIFYG